MLDNEIVGKLIEDFRATNAEKLREDHDMLLYIKGVYDAAWAATEERNKEIEYHRELYQNKKPDDFFFVANNDEEKKRIFRSAIVPKTVEQRASIMTDRKARAFVNPNFVDGFADSFSQAVANAFANDDYTWGWVLQKLQENDGLIIGQDEATGQQFVQGVKQEQAQIFFDEIFDLRLNEWMQKSRFRTKMYLYIKDSLLAGEGFLKMRKIEDSFGNPTIVLENIDPCFVSCDPYATIENDIRWMFHTKPLHIRDIEMRYGLKRGTLQAEKDWSEKRDGIKDEMPEELRYLNPRARLVEAYWTDEREEEFEGEEYRVYPYPRIITFVCGQNTQSGIRVLRDSMFEYSINPIFKYIPEPMTETTGKPMVRDLAPIQKIADKSLQQALRNLEVVGNARILYEEGEFEIAANLTNTIAELIPVDHIGGVKYEAPTPVIDQGVAIYQLMNSIAQDISGIHEVAEGRRPSGIQASGRAILSLQEGTNRRIRPSMRRLEDKLVDIVTLWAEMELDEMTAGYEVRCGEGFRTTYSLPFDMSEYINGVTVYIGEDTSVPKDPEAIANMMIQFSGMVAEDGLPYTDRQTVYETLGFENYDKVKSRLDKVRNMQQELAAMQQQLEQAGMQMQQMQSQAGMLEQENQKLQMKIAGAEQRSRATLIQQSMKEQGMANRQMNDLMMQMQQMRADIDKEIMKVSAQIAVAKEKSGDRDSRQTADS